MSKEKTLPACSIQISFHISMTNAEVKKKKLSKKWGGKMGTSKKRFNSI